MPKTAGSHLHFGATFGMLGGKGATTMDTKKLRAMAEPIANGGGTWSIDDAKELARAILDEVPDNESYDDRVITITEDELRGEPGKCGEAEEAHGVLVAALPYWASNYSLAAAAKAAADELDRFYDDGATGSGRLGALETHGDIARNRIAALEAAINEPIVPGFPALDERLHLIEREMAKLAERFAGLETSVPPAKAKESAADPLESARAHVATWPEWKRQAASQQKATIDMDGDPMPDPLDKGPAPSAPPGFEIVAESYIYGHDDVGLPLTLILSALGRVETLFGEALLDEGEHWIAPVGLLKRTQRLVRLGFEEPTEDQTERARIELELTREKP